MKRCYTGVLCVGLLAIGLSSAAQAALYDRGNGLIYDDVLNITWLQDANYAATQYAATSGAEGDADGAMSWNDAQAWADGLNYQGHTNWRLPSIDPLNGSSYDLTYNISGATDYGYNNNTTNTELGHLFHVSLGYLSRFYNWNYGSDESVSIFGSSLQSDKYWSGSETSDTTALYFDMLDTHQSHANKTSEFYAWAVSNGDISVNPVPLPAAVWLFGGGLMSLIGFGRFRKRS